jgi:hypothetical protein
LATSAPGQSQNLEAGRGCFSGVNPGRPCRRYQSSRYCTASSEAGANGALRLQHGPGKDLACTSSVRGFDTEPHTIEAVHETSHAQIAMAIPAHPNEALRRILKLKTADHTRRWR